MPTKVKVDIGDHLIIRDGKEENMMIKEGVVNKISDITGSNNKRIHCEGPFLIDVEK